MVAELCPDIADCWTAVVLGLVSTCWRSGQGPRDPWAAAYPLVDEAHLRVSVGLLLGRARSQGLWLQDPVYVPKVSSNCLLPLWKISKFSTWVLLKLLSNYCFCPGSWRV